MTWVSVDAGLRPIEVERATTKWVDIENRVLRIPKEESSKNTENWIVGITDRTAEALEHWLDEQEVYNRYQGTDSLRLTQEGNPYQTTSLRNLLSASVTLLGFRLKAAKCLGTQFDTPLRHT